MELVKTLSPSVGQFASTLLTCSFIAVALQGQAAHAGIKEGGGVNGAYLTCHWASVSGGDRYDIVIYDASNASMPNLFLADVTGTVKGKEKVTILEGSLNAEDGSFTSTVEGALQIDFQRSASGSLEAAFVSGKKAPLAGGVVRYVPCNGSDVIRDRR